ncbi:MAG TPA: hypothetical protein V6D29_24660 [Leptolyngbyaceae cyanobacterium]
MFKFYLRSFLETPLRLWYWAELHPYESIGYGALLLFAALFARIVITLASAIAIIAGLWHIFRN